MAKAGKSDQKVIKKLKKQRATIDQLAEIIVPHLAEGEALDKIEAKQRKARAKQEAAKSSPETIPAPRTPVDAPEGTHPKASALLVDAKGLGWNGVAFTTGDGEVRCQFVTLTRGEESIAVEWQNGVFVGPAMWTRPDGSQLKLNNVSAAKRTMQQAPPTAEQMAAKSAVRTRVGVPKSTAVKAFPFDPALMSDEGLASALPGRKITWLNRMSGAEEAEVIPGLAKITVADGKSGRTISFNASVARSVLVSSITSISGSVLKEAERQRYSRPITAKPAEEIETAEAEPSDDELAVFAADEEDGA